jgi:hypothetical protein
MFEIAEVPNRFGTEAGEFDFCLPRRTCLALLVKAGILALSKGTCPQGKYKNHESEECKNPVNSSKIWEKPSVYGYLGHLETNFC